MNKILDKIKNVPIGVKAAAVYTLASVFQKGWQLSQYQFLRESCLLLKLV